MNKPFMKKLAERIVEQPESFDMSMWFLNDDNTWAYQTKSGCGTAACLAGHACLLAGATPISEMDCEVPGENGPITIFAPTLAGKLMGITVHQQGLLFSTNQWPKKFQKAYTAAFTAKDWKGAACVAAERLKHFVDTEGKE